MKNIKRKIITSLVLATLITPTQSLAVLGVGDITFDLSTQFKQIGDMAMSNMKEASTQYADSTMKNGVSAAGDSLRSCLDFDISSLFAGLGGLDVELPCGAVWSVDNPVNQVFNQVASEMHGAFMGWAKGNINKVVNGALSKEEWYCDNMVLNLNYDYPQSKILDARRKALVENWAKTPACDKNNKEKDDSTSPMDEHDKKSNQLSSDILNDIETNGKSIATDTSKSNNYTLKVADENRELVKDLIKINEKKAMDKAYSSTLIEYDDVMLGDQETLATRKELTGVAGLTEEENEANKLKIINSIHPKASIPIPFMTSLQNNAGGNQIWSSDWGTNTPSVQMMYASPFELFPKFETKTQENGSNVVNNNVFDKLKNNQSIYYGNKQQMYLEKAISTGNQISSNEKKEEYLKLVNTTIAKNSSKTNTQTTGDFTHGKSHQLLNESANLLVGSVNNIGSDNGNAQVEMIRLEQIANGQFIQTDVLSKILELQTKSSVNDTQEKSNEYLGQINKRIAEQNLMLNEILKLQEQQLFYQKEMLKAIKDLKK